MCDRSFRSLIGDHEVSGHHITVFRQGSGHEIESWLARHGISIESRALPRGGPDPFIEIRVRDDVVGVIGIEAFERLIEPPVLGLAERPDISEGYGILFRLLEKAVFSGMTRREFLTVSREIEERAFRVGKGTLRVNFQSLSAFRAQAAVYETLASDTDLRIHIHGVDDWTPPVIDGICYHTRDAERFEPYWVIAYDGGLDSTKACGLVAEELECGYTGFWTSDPSTVQEIASILSEGEMAFDYDTCHRCE